MTNSGILSPAVAALDAHFHRSALPHWLHTGWNGTLDLPHEALNARGAQPKETGQFRTMACARQLYLFSLFPEHRAHADRLFASLAQKFYDRENGGWYFSVGEDGRPLDCKRDLYTHAFVIFACAHYAQRTGRADAFALMHCTADYVERAFKIKPGVYGFLLAENDACPTGELAPPLQNPIMHLFEAYLAVVAADDATADIYAARLRSIADGVLDTFGDPSSGCITEQSIGTVDNWIEPGHQFEWYSLATLTGDLIDGSKLPEFAAGAFGFARKHGIDEQHGAIASLTLCGAALDRTTRLWAQTEYLRALALRNGRHSLDDFQDALTGYTSRFLTDFGWHECLNAAGEVVRTDMPCTTPYHMCTAYETLRDIFVA